MMHGNQKWWAKKKQELARKQEEYNEERPASTKKLKRSRITGSGKHVVDFEIWPAEPPILQRIANFMDHPTTPGHVKRKLESGEKITTKHGSVYSLVPIAATKH